MLGSSRLIAGLDIATGTFALMVFSVCAALVVLAVMARIMLRRAGKSGMANALVVFGLGLVGGLSVYALFDRSMLREQATERRAIEARAAELTARSLAPGSALGCLDAVASVVVENACERPLFASPEAVAAAVGYIDARFSLLVASAALAERDSRYQPAFERLRRALEADRYGLVAHVLMTRGCNGAECAELRFLRDPSRVIANIKARAFESSLGVHAGAWQPNGATVASSPSSSTTPPALAGAGPGGPVTSGGPAAAGKFDFPSASSIPAVSIMNAEPGSPPAVEPRSATLPSKRPAAAPQSRRPAAREAVAPSSPPPPPPPPPTQIVPEPAPVEPVVRSVPDVHSNR